MTASIRPATPADAEAVRRVHRLAFPAAENEQVAALAVALLAETSEPETVSLVAESGGEVVGHVAFSPVGCDADPGWLGYLLAPLAVVPAWHGRGVGSALVRSGMARLSDQGIDVVLVYGDPAYYGRFGFEAAAAARFRAPYPLQHPFGWQAAVVRGGECGGEGCRVSCVAPLRDPALW